MSPYEMRVDPDGYDVAVRNCASVSHPWRVTNGGHYRDEQVADWIPLVRSCPAALGPFRCTRTFEHDKEHLALREGRRIEWSES